VGRAGRVFPPSPFASLYGQIERLMKGRFSMHSYPSTRPASRCGFTLVEIMIVVLIIGILLAIAAPSFISSRETSRSKACVANLYQINSAKLQCVMDNKLALTSTATFSVDGVTPTAAGPNGTYQLTRTGGSANYIRTVPVCPATGVYAPGSVSAAPTCSVATDSSAPPDYQAGGRWYHGY